MTTTVYFAYGSNLDRAQMRARCPAARLVGRATLPAHALAFVGHSALWGGAVATVRRSAGAEVPGALYELIPDDLQRLDRFEAGYRRLRRQVVTNGGSRRVDLYVLDRAIRGSPSDAYLEAIARGYRSFGYALEALAAHRSER